VKIVFQSIHLHLLMRVVVAIAAAVYCLVVGCLLVKQGEAQKIERLMEVSSYLDNNCGCHFQHFTVEIDYRLLHCKKQLSVNFF